MTSVVKALYQQYQEELPYADPNSRDWLLLNNNPVPVWVLSLVYLVFVYGGPHYMKNRPAYSLQWFMVVYNLGLVVLSAYMVIEILISTSIAGYPWLCAPYNAETRKRPEELRVAQVMWWYFFSKAIELMDTVLMVLRKRDRQITFLHVFHHLSMLNIWWWVTMFIPGGLSYFGPCLNCLVHVVMYGYYGLAAIPSLRDKLWWKTYITQFQLIQFCITLSHTIYTITSGCDFPLWGKNLLAGYMVIMLVLFSNFYIQAYTKRSQRKPASKTLQNGTKQENSKMQNGDSLSHMTNGLANGKKEE